jgi:hypothetical protein
MSCLKPGYNPNPTRQWSRVQNPCTFDNVGQSTSGVTYIPQLRRFVPNADVLNQLNMLRKGNILQYKANSTNITKAQRYSQICKGAWTNRTTTWATQTDQFTNPNTRSLKRVNVNRNITMDGTTTDAEITCPKDILNNPNITVVIQDGGSLVYNVIENPCTGETIVQSKPNYCNPTTNSDVPGPIINLCYDATLPTYYVKTRTIMSNSANKWPQGQTMLGSANGIPSEST